MELFIMLLVVFLAVCVPASIVLSLTYINRNSKKILVKTLGFNSQIYLGCFGIIAHEFSHFIIAIFFGHQIKEAKFLILPSHVGSDGSLGYVNHGWDGRSLWQSLGNLFIGTAPVFGCTGVLYLIIKYMLQGLFAAFTHFQEALLAEQWTTLFSYPIAIAQTPKEWLIAFIAICLIANITIGGFDLSNADLNGSLPAFFTFYGLLAIICATMYCIGLSNLVNSILLKGIIIFSIVMSLSLIISIVMNLLLRYLHFFVKL